jgi:hypothetical protein
LLARKCLLKFGLKLLSLEREEGQVGLGPTDVPGENELAVNHDLCKFRYNLKTV